MKNTFKRIAVIALAVIMCVSAAVPAFAAGNACPGVGKTHTAFNCTYVEANKQEATCDAAGFVTGKCTTCATIFSVSQTEALGHTWETTAAICGTAASRTCKVCDKVESVGAVLDHLYTAWTLTEGECGVAGARVTRTCVYCDDLQTERLGDEGHIFVLVSYIEPAKCVGEGLATYECVVAGCDAVKEATVYATANAGHSYVLWDAEDLGKKDPNFKKATCSEKGRVSMICEDCKNVVVVATDMVAHDTVATEAKAPECTKAGNIAYWRCLDCKKYFSNAALTTVIEKEDTVIPAIHDGLKTSATAIDYEYLPTCDTDGLVIYSCKEANCEEAGEYTIPKYTKHVYYNDVKDVATKAAIINALANDVDCTEGWSDARVEAFWAELGNVDFDALGEDLVWSNYVPADCEKNATVTYRCLNYTYSYKTGSYVFATCNVATETTLTGEGYTKTGHTFADYYPANHSTKAGQKAYTWEGGLEASCKTVGRKISTCINEYYNADGDLVSCTKTETKGVSALGHNYVAYDKAVIDDAADYTLKTETMTGAELKVLVADTKVTCVEDGKAYTVCTRCNDVQATDVTSAGTEHSWTYVDGLNNPVTPAPTCVEGVKGIYRKCTVTTCKAYLTLEPVEIPATGHKYADTSDKDVVASILKGTYAYAEPVTPGTCENGATYQLKCENCSFPKAFEIKEGFGGGHVKTYLPNTAIAATCTNGYSSNQWYCANKNCEYYGYIKNDGTEVMPSEFGVDVTTDTTHKIWDAKKEEYVAVTYKNVPDANVSGAKTEADAKKVEAPVVDGKVVRSVAIEGTSYVWVYKYESDDCYVASVSEGFLFCVDCADEDDFDDFIADGHDWDETEVDSTCVSVGYTEYTCKDCFVTYVEDITPVTEHDFDNLTTVEPTCDRAGYEIDECKDCGKVVTTALKALGHTVNGAELTSSCLNTLTTRKCTRCNTTIAKAHNFNENGMCVECGAAK